MGSVALQSVRKFSAMKRDGDEVLFQISDDAIGTRMDLWMTIGGVVALTGVLVWEVGWLGLIGALPVWLFMRLWLYIMWRDVADRVWVRNDTIVVEQGGVVYNISYENIEKVFYQPERYYTTITLELRRPWKGGKQLRFRHRGGGHVELIHGASMIELVNEIRRK